MPPTDRLLEARRIFGAAVGSSKALVEKATALEKAIAGAAESVASLRTQVSRLHDELDELAAAVADQGRVLQRAWVVMIVSVVLGGFLGALLGSAAAQAWPWLFG